MSPIRFEDNPPKKKKYKIQNRYCLFFIFFFLFSQHRYQVTIFRVHSKPFFYFYSTWVSCRRRSIRLSSEYATVSYRKYILARRWPAASDNGKRPEAVNFHAFKCTVFIHSIPGVRVDGDSGRINKYANRMAVKSGIAGMEYLQRGTGRRISDEISKDKTETTEDRTRRGGKKKPKQV